MSKIENKKRDITSIVFVNVASSEWKHISFKPATFIYLCRPFLPTLDRLQ